MKRVPLALLLLMGATAVPPWVLADVPAGSQPASGASKHQMMKDCMAKQKASDGGMPKEDMKRNCKDVTKTEMENQKAAAKRAASPPADTPPP